MAAHFYQEVSTKHARSLLLATLMLAAPLAAGAAPAGKVVIAQGVDPSTLDTQNQQEAPASVVATHIYDTLVERDPSLKIVPALAAELPVLVAPTTWEVKLRKGVKFHNGEEFNAESVKYSLERVKGPGMRASSNLGGGRARRAAVPAGGPLRSEPAPRVEGAERRADQGLRHVAERGQVGLPGAR